VSFLLPGPPGRPLKNVTAQISLIYFFLTIQFLTSNLKGSCGRGPHPFVSFVNYLAEFNLDRILKQDEYPELDIMADNNQLEILSQGVAAWNKWREENPDVLIDLNRAKLMHMNLENANLVKADLKEANLAFTNFKNANLVFSNLESAIFSFSNFEGANFSGAQLENAYLEDANLSRARLSGANLKNAIMANSNLKNAYLVDGPFYWPCYSHFFSGS